MTALECAALQEVRKARVQEFRTSGLSGRQWCARAEGEPGPLLEPQVPGGRRGRVGGHNDETTVQVLDEAKTPVPEKV